MIGKRHESIIFDTGAFALYFGGKKEVKKYFNLVLDGKVAGYVPEIVIIELQYKICQKLGKKVAIERGASVLGSNIIIVSTSELSGDVWLVKCQHGDRFSLVDSYLYALTRKLNGILVTTDSAFVGLEKEGIRVRLIEV